MAYKTNLIKNKREQLKSQMDDFATFQWRGHDMFEDFGCFIINDKNGSLKFYNGPSFSNQYAKPQFSSSVSGLLGIDFKQQTIPMKVGLYWFTIEEYEKFLHEIGPHQVNYLTFNFAKDYGYLVKLGKISDSPRHVLGRDENGEYRYYTELDLTWELLGDNCVRSNLPYEYKRDSGQTSSSDYTWVFDDTHSDMKDSSKLDTPLLFEIPLTFTDSTASLTLDAKIQDKNINLFNVELQNLTINNSWKPGPYRINHTVTGFPRVFKTSYTGTWVSEFETLQIAITPDNPPTGAYYGTTIDHDPTKNEGIIVVELDPTCVFTDYKITSGGGFCISQEFASNQITLIFDVDEDEFSRLEVSVSMTVGKSKQTLGESGNFTPLSLPIRYNDKNYHYVFLEKDSDEEQPSYIVLVQDLKKIDSLQRIAPTQYVWTWDKPTTDKEKFLSYISNISVDTTELNNKDFWAQYYNIYQMFLRYDSETGLIYIQEGSNDTWHLLNYQISSTTGDYILKSAYVSKFLLPGTLHTPQLNSTEWSFELKTTGIDLSTGPIDAYNTALTIYARKKIV